jgi:GDPmannose 4,6-dehydratase
MKIALITWINWQDWAYLSKYLIEKWYKVIWLIKSKDSDINNLKYFKIVENIDFVYWDIRDKELIENIIKKYKPDEIYNLGWMSSPWQSWDNIEEYVEVNNNSIINLLEAIKIHSPKSRLFQASTSEMFWNSHDEWLQVEETPFKPTNPYAVTKVFWYWMTNIYKESYWLYICNWILFNHESPLRNIKFVTRKITDWVARIKLWLSRKITLWNLDAMRDWWFAWDYVEAMWLMLQQDRPDNYILSTWVIHTLKELLTTAFRHVWIDNWEEYIEIDQRFNRPINLVNLYWSNEKAKNVLGWSPKMDFDSLIKNMVDEDLKRLK